MAIKFEKLTAGMELHDVHSRPMGNTTMRELGDWPVRIISVDPVARSAVVSWNGNRPETYYESSLKVLYAKPPPKYLAQQERQRTRGGW